MDTKHRKVYAVVKQHGVAEVKQFNEGMSIAQLLPAIGRHIGGLPSRYTDLHIHMSFSPIVEHKTEQEKHLAELIAGLDLSNMEVETEEEAAIWDSNPMNPDCANYDPLYHEYQNCGVLSHRRIKTPDDLGMLRKHVESTYAGTRWWDGSHRW